jgi:hypothetical protein
MKPKTPSYTLKAVSDHHKRKKASGLVQYSRYIKPEWREALDKLLTTLKSV